jgi:hypothetical protein
MEQQQHHARRLQPTNQQPTRITSQDVLPIYVRNESNINQIYEALIGTRVETNQTQFYQEFERIRIEEEISEHEAMTCSVCFEELSDGSETIQLPSPCSHVYHEECIMIWLDRSNTCPLCRRHVM